MRPHGFIFRIFPLVFILAACGGGIKECNLWAAAIDKMRRDGNADAGNRFLFVGSVDVYTNTIKDYSTTAGDMTHDFIVAGDRIFNTDEEDNGTSQAAPRVAGAAVFIAAQVCHGAMRNPIYARAQRPLRANLIFNGDFK